MNIKNFDTNKINLKKNKIILIYGKNEGLKNNFKKKLIGEYKNILSYDQNDILDNENIFFENLSSKSLFETEKIIIIKRANDKIVKIIEKISEKNLDEVIIIIDADNLEKKSKLRSLFERHKNYICVAFYPESQRDLFKVAYEFLKEKKILISSSSINTIIEKSNGDRGNLLKELEKIQHLSITKKKITEDDISKLTNLIEDYNISELIDYCLAKNKRKTIHILNENNFNNEESILIIRTFLNKSKRVLKLTSEYKKNKNIDLTISTAKPPIFWKDKDLIKQQIYKWTPEKIKQLIYKLNEMELIIKKNINNSVNMISDFILEQAS
tara:strand:+ start:588 stop:1565 length:978 start_codon:yes stop_codon:yes gene_type:complete